MRCRQPKVETPLQIHPPKTVQNPTSHSAVNRHETAIVVLDCEQGFPGCSFHAIIIMTNSRSSIGSTGYVLMVLLQNNRQGKVCAVGCSMNCCSSMGSIVSPLVRSCICMVMLHCFRFKPRVMGKRQTRVVRELFGNLLGTNQSQGSMVPKCQSDMVYKNALLAMEANKRKITPSMGIG